MADGTMDIPSAPDGARVIHTTGGVMVSSRGDMNINGDMLGPVTIVQPSWVRDVLAASQWDLFSVAWTLAFGAMLGGATAVMLSFIIDGAWRWVVGHG